MTIPQHPGVTAEPAAPKFTHSDRFLQVLRGRVDAYFEAVKRSKRDSPRMYFLVDNHDYGSHELELRCSPGVAAFAFTFTSCVDPVASATQSGLIDPASKH